MLFQSPRGKSVLDYYALLLYMSLYLYVVCMYSQYTMLTGKPPFLEVGYRELSESTMLGMMQRIIAGSYSQDTPEWQCISEDAKSLIQGIKMSAFCCHIQF